MKDITTVITNYMLGDDETMPSRLRKREMDLQKLTCEQKEIGKYLEKYEISVLIDILNSSDEYFNEYFSHMKSFNRSKRQAFAREIEHHGKTCPRCRLKIQNDLDWEKEFDVAVSNHRQSLEETFKSRTEFFKNKK